VDDGGLAVTSLRSLADAHAGSALRRAAFRAMAGALAGGADGGDPVVLSG
jgi:hypothetical protein